MKPLTKVSLPKSLATTTSTVPGPWEGVVQVMVVGDCTVTPVAGKPPKVTVVDPKPVKLLPVTVTAVPPAGEPLSGETDVMFGAL